MRDWFELRLNDIRSDILNVFEIDFVVVKEIRTAVAATTVSIAIEVPGAVECPVKLCIMYSSQVVLAMIEV